MKLRTSLAIVSAALMGLSAPGFAQAAHSHDGGGTHFSGSTHAGGGHSSGGERQWSGGGHNWGGGGYRRGYRGGYGGYALGLGLLGAAAIAAPYYGYPYAYAPAYPAPGYGSYFCRSYNAYYPQVQQCPEGWQQAAPQQQQYRPY